MDKRVIAFQEKFQNKNKLVMAQEELMEENSKQLLLNELRARSPYGVKILHEGWNFEWDDELSTVEKVVGIDKDFIYTKVINTHNGEEYRDDKWPIDTFDAKLFLRPMSSMTEEQKKEYNNLNCYEVGCFPHTEEALDYLNKNHFDYRNLTNKNLAIDCTNLNIY